MRIAVRKPWLQLRLVKAPFSVTCALWIAFSASAQEHPDLVRVGAVNTPYYTGLLDVLVDDFKKKGGTGGRGAGSGGGRGRGGRLDAEENQ